jgi:hypothetical protein
MKYCLQGYIETGFHPKIGRHCFRKQGLQIIIGRLAKIWDFRNMWSMTADSLRSVDGLIIDKDISFFCLSKFLLSNIFAENFETYYILLKQRAMV